MENEQLDTWVESLVWVSKFPGVCRPGQALEADFQSFKDDVRRFLLHCERRFLDFQS